jgi:hypothetical protein
MPPEDKRGVNTNLSCTFCGPGTWSTWEVVTDDGVVFACDRHHVEMGEAKIIRLERMRGKKSWKKIKDIDSMSKENEPINDFEKDESQPAFTFEWAKGNVYEHWVDVDGGRIRVRTEIAYFKLPEEGSQENIAYDEEL